MAAGPLAHADGPGRGAGAGGAACGRRYARRAAGGRMRDDAATAWKSARHIVCIRLDNLGDVLMSTPALRALKALPGRPRLTLLASSAGAAAAAFLPDIDAVLRYDAPWVKNDAAGHRQDLEMIRRLRNENFDAAVVFTVYS